MFDRRYLNLKGLLLVGLALSLGGCDSPTLVSITITPTVQYFSWSASGGLSTQFTAIGTFDQGNHPKTTQDITNEVTWKSNAPQVATVSSTGLVTTTGTAYGGSNITASMNGFTGLIIANATADVCPPGQVASSTGCSTSTTSGIRTAR
ncbi:MAG TPA: Ig-like domain-containing protein [Acidobacteriaceae bacterium]|nr:Ig-like domain-containing protein [Acidobacteriaceae bacterium]